MLKINIKKKFKEKSIYKTKNLLVFLKCICNLKNLILNNKSLFFLCTKRLGFVSFYSYNNKNIFFIIYRILLKKQNNIRSSKKINKNKSIKRKYHLNLKKIKNNRFNFFKNYYFIKKFASIKNTSKIFLKQKFLMKTTKFTDIFCFYIIFVMKYKIIKSKKLQILNVSSKTKCNKRSQKT